LLCWQTNIIVGIGGRIPEISGTVQSIIH